MPYPQRLKIRPLMGLTAMRNGAGDAWRLWIIAKNLDVNGRGSIESEKLLSFANYLQVHPKSYRRWLSHTESLGLITPCTHKAADLWLILSSQEIAAKKIGCFYVGQRPVSIPAQVLVDNGWHAWIWASYITTHRGRPISRSKLREITGVPESTQRQYETSLGVKRKENYIISNRPIDHLIGVQENLHSHDLPFWDKENKRLVVAWRGPDSRDASKFAYCLNRGRSRKINKKLDQNCGLSYVELAQPGSVPRMESASSAGPNHQLQGHRRTPVHAGSTVTRHRFHCARDKHTHQLLPPVSVG
jgi:hypothetical protein